MSMVILLSRPYQQSVRDEVSAIIDEQSIMHGKSVYNKWRIQIYTVLVAKTDLS